MSRSSQKAEVLDHLKRGGSLTPLRALNLFGIMRLAAVVYDLKKDGHNVVSERIEVNKAGGGSAKVASYSLKAPGSLFPGLKA